VAVNDESRDHLASGARIIAVVTQAERESLGLRTKMTAIDWFKSSSIVDHHLAIDRRPGDARSRRRHVDAPSDTGPCLRW